MLVGPGVGLLPVTLAVFARFGATDAVVEFGWFAYADGAPSAFFLVTSREVWAVVAGTLGVGLAAAGAGYAAGARRARAPSEGAG